MSEALEKISEMREVMRDPSPEDAEWLANLERDVKHREQYQDFLNHPITKEIVDRILSWIEYQNSLLLGGKGDATTVVRRDNLLDLISIFSPSKSKTDHIVKVLEPKIKEFRDYYKI